MWLPHGWKRGNIASEYGPFWTGFNEDFSNIRTRINTNFFSFFRKICFSFCCQNFLVIFGEVRFLYSTLNTVDYDYDNIWKLFKLKTLNVPIYNLYILKLEWENYLRVNIFSQQHSVRLHSVLYNAMSNFKMCNTAQCPTPRCVIQRSVQLHNV